EWLSWAESVGRSLGALVGASIVLGKKGLDGPIVHGVSRSPLSNILNPAPIGRWLEARYLAFGQRFQILFLSAEPSADYVTFLAKVFAGAWMIGYLGDVFGYLPTDEQIPQGGYEVEEFLEVFGLNGRWIGRNNETLANLISRFGFSGITN